jgi:hypothetical protein
VQRYTLADSARATGYEGPAPREDTFVDIWKLGEGDASAKERLIAAADAEREALMHLLQWLRRLP